MSCIKLWRKSELLLFNIKNILCKMHAKSTKFIENVWIGSNLKELLEFLLKFHLFAKSSLKLACNSYIFGGKINRWRFANTIFSAFCKLWNEICVLILISDCNLCLYWKYNCRFVDSIGLASHEYFYAI